jgi:hypothetical protein
MVWFAPELLRQAAYPSIGRPKSVISNGSVCRTQLTEAFIIGAEAGAEAVSVSFDDRQRTTNSGG